MRILLDECVNVDFAPYIVGHDVETVRGVVWTGVMNGLLLKQASEEFDAFLTIDRGIEHQQHLPSSLAFLVLRTFNGRIESIVELLPEVMDALSRVSPGEVVNVQARGRPFR